MKMSTPSASAEIYMGHSKKKTHPDKDSLALEVDIGNRQLVGQRHVCLVQEGINWEVDAMLKGMRRCEDV